MALSELWGEVEPVMLGGEVGVTSAWHRQINRISEWTGAHTLFSLAAIALVSISLYALLALRYPLVPSLTDPRASWGLLIEPSRGNLAIHLAIYAGLTILYVLALKLLGSGRSSNPGWMWALIVGSWLLYSAVLMTLAPGGESHDIFDYIFRGRMMAEYGANPLEEVPKALSKAPYYRYAAWIRNVDTYGPLWEMTNAGVAVAVRSALQAFDTWTAAAISCPKSPLSCRMLIGYLSGYRLLAIGLTGISTAFIFDMVRSSRPQLAAAAVVAWLWSPMLLLATAVGAHNDALMIALLLAALWMLQRHRLLPALLVVIAAAHVKLTVLIFLPAVGLWVVRQRGWLRAIAISIVTVAVGLCLSWLLYAPFDGWGTLPRMLHERSLYLANSAWHVIYYQLYIQGGWSQEAVYRLTVQLPTVLFVVGAVLIALWMLDFRPQRWKRSPLPDWDDDRLLWRAIAALGMFYLIVGSFWFQHWYVLWALAPAALLPDSTLTRVVLPWLSFGALSANVMGDFLRTTIPKGISRTGIYTQIVLMIWVPAIIAGLVAATSRLHRRRQEQRHPRMST